VLRGVPSRDSSSMSPKQWGAITFGPVSPRTPPSGGKVTPCSRVVLGGGGVPVSFCSGGRLRAGSGLLISIRSWRYGLFAGWHALAAAGVAAAWLEAEEGSRCVSGEVRVGSPAGRKRDEAGGRGLVIRKRSSPGPRQCSPLRRGGRCRLGRARRRRRGLTTSATKPVAGETQAVCLG